MSTKNLPTLERFKKEAWNYKNKHNIKISQANNILAKEYGFKNYQAIKPQLEKVLESNKSELQKLNSLINSLIEKYRDKKRCLVEIKLVNIDYKKLSELIPKVDNKKLLIEGYSFINEENDEILYLYKSGADYINIVDSKTVIANGTEIKINNEYIIQPDNHRKLKHRNRTCIIIDFNDNFMPSQASVKFTDTKRKGNVDLIDLKNIK